MSVNSQFLVNTSTNLEITVYVDGTATDADTDTVTLGITDGAGAEVVAAGTAYTSKNGTGVYRYLLAPQTQVKTLTATWAVTVNGVVQTLVTNHEVVGGFLFSEAEARAHGALQDDTGPLGTAAEYPDALIARHRAEITDLLEQWTGVSWVPRWHTETIAGNGMRTLEAEKRIVSTVITATVGGTDVSSSTTVDGWRSIVRTSGSWTNPTAASPYNVVLAYRHGHETLKYGVKEIALMLLHDRIVPKTIPPNTLSYDTDLGSVRVVQPGGPMMNVSSVPAVNQWVKANDVREAVF